MFTPWLRGIPRPRFAHIERLNQQRGELVGRRDELQQRLAGALQALEGVQKEQGKLDKVGGQWGQLHTVWPAQMNGSKR